ncbi:MAG: tRNA (adenosine(37)-N6)-dimethylallyltransferase MiaA [Nitratireductor sp.]|nr:tRNA (adenosine(37)-N6)-dimethylallyltransferase MiaA [Nitratireductor sp.]
MTVRAILIAGPTASGKTELALRLAERFGGEVVNADSMQVYAGLRLITARPNDGETARAPHHLFGHVDPADGYSVAHWLADAERSMRAIAGRGGLPILAGGTGLYFNGLLKGLNAVPPVDPGIRAELRERAAAGDDGLFLELEAADPQTASKLRPGDTQRVARALEVVRSTGRPLSWWQAQPTSRPLLSGGDYAGVVLEPERAVLRERIAARFRAMVAQGALEEAADFMARGLPAVRPAMRAIGMGELSAHLRGEISLEAAMALAITATQQYAKRQSTWFRNQFGVEWLRADRLESAVQCVGAKVDGGNSV